MNIRLFGKTVWGDEPPLPLAQSIKEREEEFERELIKQELDLIDAAARKEGLRQKIEYLRKYNRIADIDMPAITRIRKESSK